MLDRVTADHFQLLQGQVCQFDVPGGESLSLRVDSVTLKPLARMPETGSEARTPFSVGLTAMSTTELWHGLCSVELPQLGRIDNVMIEREAALGRDPGGLYFQILFN